MSIGSASSAIRLRVWTGSPIMVLSRLNRRRLCGACDCGCWLPVMLSERDEGKLVPHGYPHVVEGIGKCAEVKLAPRGLSAGRQ